MLCRRNPDWNYSGNGDGDGGDGGEIIVGGGGRDEGIPNRVTLTSNNYVLYNFAVQFGYNNNGSYSPSAANTITSGLTRFAIGTGWEQTGSNSYVYPGSTLIYIVITGKQWFGIANSIPTLASKYITINIVFNSRAGRYTIKSSTFTH